MRDGPGYHRRAHRAPLAAPPGESPAARRERLLVRSAALRVKLAHEVRSLQAPLAVVDTVTEGARWLRRHPQAPLAVAALVAALRPRRVLRWAARGWTVWQAWRRATRLAAALLGSGR